MADNIAPFIQYPDPRLALRAEPRPVDDGLREIAAALLRAGAKAQAYGLAAAHIGEVAPIVLISLSDPETRDYRLLFNPRIVSTSGPDVAGKEGSLSMPGIEVDVVRPESACIAYDDADGNPGELDLSGFAARVAQHEIDQVNGVFFLARISRLKRDTALKRFAKVSRKG